MVGKDISVANLIYVMKTLLKEIFKKDVKIRLRPGYFPFVEPGFEADFGCLNCGGRGCPVCGYTGWVEMVGCGMIHPRVFEFAGYPKNKYTGFAFGFGFDRLVMMKHKINDIRWFHGGDLRFLRQF
jgi:phenylalanyl-tRNA synthetase alpha chain